MRRLPAFTPGTASKRPMDQLQPLLKKTLMVVAHPDDEVIAFGAIMQRMRDAVVVFATDGAPRDDYFWKDYGSREAYAQVRRQEAHTALSIVGARPIFLADLVPTNLVDQELFRNLPEAFEALGKVMAQERPDAVLTLAYEGGHPDHDSACFLASNCARSIGLPVWEAPLYYRDQNAAGVAQKFVALTGQEIFTPVEGEALEKKMAMFHSYVSQELVLGGFRPELEQFRPMAEYDFTRRPTPWKLNYELWQWQMSGEEVAGAFAKLISLVSRTTRTERQSPAASGLAG
jgi:LmbE family N-acetylglucosaminyl deacetylase